MNIHVWAPHATTVELLLGDQRRPLTPDGKGTFCGDVDAETSYLLSLDGGPGRPDPRSEFQPDGVHGASQRLDHSRYTWDDADWRGMSLDDAIIYELHVGTFSESGTFAGVEEHLDELAHLGINTIELMPVAAFPGERGWGYDGVALYAVHRAYGGPHGLKSLVNACHRRGIAVVLDVVYNHLGPDGNYLGEFGPYFSEKHQTPWGAGINVDDADSSAVRAFIVDNALMWLRDYHIDGLRLDATHAIVDDSPVHILAELATAVRALGSERSRRRWVIAESDANDPRLVTGSARDGYGLDAQWCEDIHHAIHSFLAKERSGYYVDFGTIADIVDALNQGFVYDGKHSEFRGEPHGASPEGVPLNRFVAYIQNHDQIGNRAAGERFAHLAGIDRQMIAAATILLAPMTPLIFMGEEWATSSPFLYFTNHLNQKLGASVSKDRAAEFADFGWKPEDVPDPQDVTTFARSVLRWDERSGSDNQRMLTWYSHLIQLRRLHPADPAVARADIARTIGNSAYALCRGELTLICNCGTSELSYEAAGVAGQQVVFSSRPTDGTIPTVSAVIFATLGHL